MPKSRKTSRKRNLKSRQRKTSRIRKIKSRQQKNRSKRHKSVLRMDSPAGIQYQSPPPDIEFYRHIDQNAKRQRVLEHARRLEGEFIFDFDNFCNNTGLVDDLAFFFELDFYVRTGQIKPSAMNNSIFGTNGIFKDSTLIPTLIHIDDQDKIEHITSTSKGRELIFYYGRHIIRLLVPNPSLGKEDPHRILGKGTYGGTYRAYFDNEEMVIKTLHQKSKSDGKIISEKTLLTNLVRETVIQSYLSCKYSKFFKDPDAKEIIAAIPSIKMIGKNDVGKGKFEYYIGMDKLSQSFETYLFNNMFDIELIKHAINSVCRLINVLQMHERFLHRDLHTGNVMYNKTNNQFYMIDFGMSCLLNKNVFNNDTNLYAPIAPSPSHYYSLPNFNTSHDLRLFLGSILDTMNRSLPPAIGRIIAKRFAYFAFYIYKPVEKEPAIFHGLYGQVYDFYDFRFDPIFIAENGDDVLEDFQDQTGTPYPTPTPQEVASWKPLNRLQRLVQFYYR
jgi:hypothetical protein